jgi:hypothetical protein
MEDLSIYLTPTYCIDCDSPLVSLISKKIAASHPFEKVMDGFRGAYTEDMLRRWEDSSLQTQQRW